MTDWNQRRQFVCAMVDRCDRKETIAGPSRRTCSFQYNLKVGDRKIRVCAKMFEQTIMIPHRTILHWLENTSHGLTKTSDSSPKQSRTEGKAREDKQRMQDAKTFLEKLDKVPSHYCRASTQKYLWPGEFKSSADVHRAYVKWVEEQSIGDTSPISLSSLKKLLEEESIAIWQPRKDRCDRCLAYAQGNIGEEEYQSHTQKKQKAREEKTRDKEDALSDKDVLVVTVDVQAVQTVPKTQASCLYFRTKLSIHNYTVYNVGTQEVICYVWTEDHGGLTASVFTSCIVDFLDRSKQENPALKKVVVWSDGCSAQNRNSTLISALATWSQRNGTECVTKYLEKGHTQMEVDSVHAKIETIQKRTDMEVPADYCRLIRQARRKPFPFKFRYLQYNFFKNFESCQIYDSVRPGLRKGDPCLTDVKQFRCDAQGTVYFKLSHDPHAAYELLPQRRRSERQTDPPPPLYNGRIPISRKKYSDLQDLKLVLHPNNHSFYDSLPFAQV